MQYVFGYNNYKKQIIMTNSQETGHARNVSNFEFLIVFLESLGEKYNPSKELISLSNVKSVFANSRSALTAVKLAESNYAIAVDARSSAFALVQPLITRVKNSLKASNTSTLTDESVETIFRKVQGKRSTPKLSEEEIGKLKEEGKIVTQNSITQLSYDRIIDNFDKLIILLETIPEYAPNEVDLKTESLRAFHTNLNENNAAVTLVVMQLENARINRNDVMYRPITGLTDIAADIKSYIKSLFGATSPFYKQISGVNFRNYKK